MRKEGSVLKRVEKRWEQGPGTTGPCMSKISLIFKEKNDRLVG